MSLSNEPLVNILFDLGNVLVPVHWERAIERISPHVSPDNAALLTQGVWAFQELVRDPATALETGQIEMDKFYRTVSTILGLRLSEEEFHDIWCDIFTLDEQMVELGTWLAQTYSTWLLSNTNAAHYQWIVRRFPRVVFYRAAALSYELGVMKPDTRYYELALRQFNIKPEQSVFIDDREENVEGALRLGIRGIVFKGVPALIRELSALGIKVPEDKGSNL